MSTVQIIVLIIGCVMAGLIGVFVGTAIEHIFTIDKTTKKIAKELNQIKYDVALTHDYIARIFPEVKK